MLGQPQKPRLRGVFLWIFSADAGPPLGGSLGQVEDSQIELWDISFNSIRK